MGMSALSSKGIIVLLLGISSAVSAYILAVDEFLWQMNPINYHAYALVLFLAVDAVLILLTLKGLRFSAFLTMGWGGLQVALIIGDVVGGLGLPGVSATAAYRFLILGEDNPSGLATDFLVVLYALLFFVSLRSFLASRRGAAETVACPHA